MKLLLTWIFWLPLGCGLSFGQTVQPSANPAPVARNTWDQGPQPGGGILTFESDMHDFGEIEEGSEAKWTFRFTKTGTGTIEFYPTKSSFGPPPPLMKPVAPGGEGEITIQYDTHRIGTFSKSIAIQSNASEPAKALSYKGTVVPLPKYHAPELLKPAEIKPK